MTRSPFDDPAAYVDLIEEAFSVGQVSVEEVAELPFDMVNITVDQAGVEKLFWSAAAGGQAANLSISVWLDRETGMLQDIDVNLYLEDKQGYTVELDGTIYYEPWDQPIPLPAGVAQ